MRFRHKLSIVLVGLAVVPLVAAGLIVQALLARDEVRSVDAQLSVDPPAVGFGRFCPNPAEHRSPA